MPIAQKYSVNDTVTYLVWEITETEEELLAHLRLNEEELTDFNAVKVQAKRLEWLGARTALKFLVKEHGQFYLYKDEFGKPHLKDTSIGISVSHANGYGAAAINLNGEVGIDIETERPQIHKISKRFLHASEKDWAEDNREKLTKIWTAKEALYKLHGRTQLIFAEQLIVSNFDLANESGMIVESGTEMVYKLSYGLTSGTHICCAY